MPKLELLDWKLIRDILPTRGKLRYMRMDI